MASQSPRELVAKLDAFRDGVGVANREAVGQAALFAKEEFIAGAVAAGLRKGGPLPSSGTARWGARFDEGTIGKTSGRYNATARIRYVGPVHWAFGGTGPHIIVARRLATRRGAQARQARIGATVAFGGSNRGIFGAMRSATTRSGRARRGARALTIPGADGPRAYAFHPGQRGRNTWPIVKNRVRRGAPEVFPAAYRGAMLRAGLGR